MNLCPKCGAYWECDCEPKQSDAEYDARGNFVVQEPPNATFHVTTPGTATASATVTVLEDSYTGDWIH